MWALVLMGAYAFWRVVPGTELLNLHAFRWVVLAVGICYWLLFFLGGVLVNRQAPRSAARVQRVLKEGVYAHVRHPIYTADIVLAWSAALFYGRSLGFAIALWLTMVLLAWMRLEEKALVQRFASQYLDYQTTTPMVIPRLRRP